MLVYARIRAEQPNGYVASDVRGFELDPAIEQACARGLECGCLEDSDIDSKVSAFIAERRATTWAPGTLVQWSIVGRGAPTVSVPSLGGRRVWTAEQAKQYENGYYNGADGDSEDPADFTLMGKLQAERDEEALDDRRNDR